jgi:anti-sigma B factor antagonist
VLFTQIDIRTRSEGPPAVVVSGEVDLACAAELRAAIERVGETEPAVLVIDLSDVSFVDSSGLGAIAGGLRAQRRHGGELKVAGAAPHVRRVFEIAGLGQLLQD